MPPFSLYDALRELGNKQFTIKGETMVKAEWLGYTLLIIGTTGYIFLPHSATSPLGSGASLVVMAIGYLLIYIVNKINKLDDIHRRQERIEVAEQNLRENPEKPQLAWELAQARLESYLARNLSQVRSIYVLTVMVMAIGFVLIGAGAYEAFQDEEKFKAAVLSAVSGVLVSFIGGTFLVLYKATMTQAKDYVTILERINAVGMSVHILESLNDEPLKQEALAEIAKNLLQMYSVTPLKGAIKKSPRTKSDGPS
jgi:hypothetical protein